MENFKNENKLKINGTNWDLREIRCQKRSYQLLMPKNISGLAIQHCCVNPGELGVDIDFWGDRRGLEALRDACALLSGEHCFPVYFPCKKNKAHFFFFAGDTDWEFLDMVLLKPNILKISDWKEIRRRIEKTPKRPWRYIQKTPQKNWPDYQKDLTKVRCRFDTLFFLASPNLYSRLAKDVEKFLFLDLEKMFRKGIQKKPWELPEDYLWFLNNFEAGVFFWNAKLYRKW